MSRFFMVHCVYVLLHAHLLCAGEAGIVFNGICPCVSLCVCLYRKWQTANNL